MEHVKTMYSGRTDTFMVTLFIHKDFPHMTLSELEIVSESIWAEIFTNKTSDHVESWYRQPGGSSKEFNCFVIARSYQDKAKRQQFMC